jgi:hypothetical protein
MSHTQQQQHGWVDKMVMVVKGRKKKAKRTFKNSCRFISHFRNRRHHHQKNIHMNTVVNCRRVLPFRKYTRTQDFSDL